jgi:hypothetical protein
MAVPMAAVTAPTFPPPPAFQAAQPPPPTFPAANTLGSNYISAAPPPYDPKAVQEVVQMLSRPPSLTGGGEQRALTDAEITNMEKAMDGLLQGIIGGADPELQGGGGADPMHAHDRIMAHVLDSRQYTSWSRSGKIRAPTKAQRHMIAELSRGTALAKVLTSEQLRDLAAGRTPPTTLRQRYVARDLLRGHSSNIQPLLTWGRSLAYPPSMDVVF